MRVPPIPTALLILALAAFAGPIAARGADDVPTPRFDRVEHAHPERHLALSPRVGDAAQIESLARQLKGKTPEATLATISQWMSRNLRYDESAAYRWRSMSEMLTERTFGGCADHAVVFGTLARAAGIPTIWVKTMDVAWIEDFRAGRDAASTYRGHVFLEVHWGNRWRLLDAQDMQLYPTYDPATRLLPGNRFAYDKGDDPFDLVLSCRWELWKRQTDAYFGSLDARLLPWTDGQDLLAPWRVWIAGNRPIYRYAEEACRRLGYHVGKTFNKNWERNLAQARGSTLIVTCQGAEPVLPTNWRTLLLPPGWEAAVAGSPPAEGYLAHRLSDGTRVVLVPGQDLTAVQVGVAKALAAGR